MANRENLVYIGSVKGEDIYEAVVKAPEKYIPMFNDIEVLKKNTKVIEPPHTRMYTKLRYNGACYFIMPTRDFNGSEGCDIYKSLPPIRNDERLIWKKTFRSKDYWASMYIGEIKFSIGYRVWGDAHVKMYNHDRAKYLIDQFIITDFPDNNEIITECWNHMAELKAKFVRAFENEEETA